MLAAADALGPQGVPGCGGEGNGGSRQISSKMVDLLNQWQLAQAGAKAEEMRKEAEKMKAKLAELAEIQRDVLEKSKELARKDQFSAGRPIRRRKLRARRT